MVAGVRNGLQSIGANIGPNLANINAGLHMFRRVIDVAGEAARTFWSTVQESFAFERVSGQFEILFRDVDKARQHIAELKEFAAKTPFEFLELSKASRVLYTFTDGVLGSVASMKLVGDTAAATGTNIEELSFWIGRAYSGISSGREWGHAAMRLQELGILTGETRNKMEDMKASNTSNIEIWNELTNAMARFSGGMERLEKTGEGKLSTLADEWKQAKAAFGDAFADRAKESITGLIETLGRLREDGTVTVWADRAIKAMDMAVKSARELGRWLNAIYKVSGASDVVGEVKGLARASQAGSLKEAAQFYMSGKAEGFYGGKITRAIGDPFGGNEQNKAWADQQTAEEDALKAGYIARKAAKTNQKPATGTQPSEDDKLTEDMARKQKTIDDNAAKERAAKALEEAKKKAEKELEERTKADERLNEQRERDQKALAAEDLRMRIENARQEHAFAKDAEVPARDRVDRAQQAVQQTWGWYKDPDSWQRQLAGERQDTAAQEQFAKDAARLQNRYQWRTTKLGDQEEVVRRVIFAREEEQAARQALLQIEANTRGLAEKLDQLLKFKA